LGTSNRLGSTSGALARTYSYNNSGSVLNSGATVHTYYNSGRMKTAKLTAASSAVTYLYNALGQRIKKSGGGVTTLFFMYDEAGHLVGEYTISGGATSTVQETVWLGDIPVATVRGTLAYYVHTDQLNTPRKVTQPNGANANKLRWTWDPTPFGEGAANENPAALGAFKYNLRFPGQYFDVETGLNYNYFRDYDPAIGRYVESDPIGLNGGGNSYAYADSVPNLAADPLGLFALMTSQTWSEADSIGSRGGLKVGGLTTPEITNINCTCVQSGGCGWVLGDCSATLAIDVKIYSGAWGPWRRFLRDKEQEHVDDLMNAMGDVFAAGKAAEEQQRGKSYGTKAQCEAAARVVVYSAAQAAVNRAANISRMTRHEGGRHTWQPSYWLFY
jgi:RHS repeat-associated protein